ncbi:MAG TPA: lysophospholipid acyltransferase family protein [Clostridia bacterium]|nr:lysophospholipid acyltransferase family protein [Clostridia bacterium]
MGKIVFTAVYVFYFSVILLLTQVVFLLPYFILRLVGLKSIALNFMKYASMAMGRMVIVATGTKVEIHGQENLPQNRRRICLVANHQGLFDIPLIAGYIPVSAGFIAKKELAWIPFLNFWVFSVGSVLINRKSRHSAVQAIRAGVERIKGGQPICIFPEGTRSRSMQMNTFKAGSLKLALRSKATIIPITIRNSFSMYEGPGYMQPTTVSLYIHPPVETEGLDDENQKGLAQRLQEVIAGPLADDQ